MATTNFETGTVITKEWLNDVNEAVYNPASIELSATDITNTPAGSIAATNVQTALNELDTKKAKAGANVDITSLASPAIGSATATTQSPGDNSTKVSTTAYVDAAVLAGGKYVIDRQTALSPAITATGLPDFGGSTGSTTVTSTGKTIIATAANGFNSAGSVDRIGQITAPSWTGLSTNGIMYLYLDIASNGTCTTGSTTLAPVYQWGGTPSTTSGQATFNIQQMQMFVGNGSTAPQTYRVFVGEVTVASNVVSAITWYALMGRYQSELFGLATSTLYTNYHNLGVRPTSHDIVLVNNSTELGYTVGDEARPADWYFNNTDVGFNCTYDRTAVTIYSHTAHQIANKTTGSVASINVAKWNVKVMANRGW